MSKKLRTLPLDKQEEFYNLVKKKDTLRYLWDEQENYSTLESEVAEEVLNVGITGIAGRHLEKCRKPILQEIEVDDMGYDPNRLFLKWRGALARMAEVDMEIPDDLDREKTLDVRKSILFELQQQPNGELAKEITENSGRAIKKKLLDMGHYDRSSGIEI